MEKFISDLSYGCMSFLVGGFLLSVGIAIDLGSITAFLGLIGTTIMLAAQAMKKGKD